MLDASKRMSLRNCFVQGHEGSPTSDKTQRAQNTDLTILKGLLYAKTFFGTSWSVKWYQLDNLLACNGPFTRISWTMYWHASFSTQLSAYPCFLESFKDVGTQGFPFNLLYTNLCSKVCMIELIKAQNPRGFRRWAIFQNGGTQYKNIFNRSCFMLPFFLWETACGQHFTASSKGHLS